MSGEEWLDIPEAIGAYQVSNLGRVRSVDRTDSHGVLRRGRVLKPKVHPRDGHLSVTLSLGGVAHTRKVHRLVLEAFVGPCPDGAEGCHFPDRDPSNNHVENLRWDTRQENIRDQLRHGTHHMARRTACSRGHEYTPETLYITSQGGRGCRICDRIRGRASHERNRAVKLARDRFRTAHVRFSKAVDEYRQQLTTTGRDSELARLDELMRSIGLHYENGTPF